MHSRAVPADRHRHRHPTLIDNPPPRLPPTSYNTLVAEETGLTLQLLPILLGFFTYKGAVLAKQSLALFAELAAGTRGSAAGGEGAGGGGEGGGEGGEGGAGMDVQSVDRAFRRRMLNEM